MRAKFYDLCEALGDMGVWVRLHYVYPYPHVDDVIPLMADRKILPYLDIPFQHASPTVLKAMKRPGNVDKIVDRIGNWRKQVPDLTLRSTFIVGFPGETESDFEMLLDFMKDAQIDRAGCFKYEAVQGAKANDIAGAVPEEVKQERYDRFMQLQQDISAAKAEEKIEMVVKCILDVVDGNGGADARSTADAPEIDGKVYLRDVPKDVKQGDIVSVLVEDADAYDLYGVLVE